MVTIAIVSMPVHAFDFLHLRKGITSATDLLSGNLQTIELKPDDVSFVDIPAFSAVVLQLQNSKTK